jgi:hypothetical protein
VGADRALNVVALQALLMRGVRNYRGLAAVGGQAGRLLATAAALDYVLMLASETAGTPIPAQQAQSAMRAGMTRAIDDALLLLRSLAGVDDPDARAFARAGLDTVRSVIGAEGLSDDDRTFALIALATDLRA